MPDDRLQVLLNNFATRAFRDIADHDYIAARLAYRHELMDQFLWSGQQAIEKYLKGILLFNRIVATKVRHDLALGLSLIEKHAPFKMRMSESSRKIIQHLDNYGRFRYFETSPYVRGGDLMALDLAVWEIRRYCARLNYTMGEKGAEKSMLPFEIERIDRSEDEPPHRFQLFGGELEAILKKKDHPARTALVWKNFRFGGRSRKRLTISPMSQAKNSPLFLHPEMLDELRKYVYLPKEVVDAYAPLAKKALERAGKK
jgi:hypothetical protein